MGVDVSDENSCGTPSERRPLILVPVVGGSSGEGLPYAPEGWPCPGDVWRWKVGTRKNASGYWVDRYLYPPIRCQKLMGSRSGFPSRPSVEQYIRKEFPGTDVKAFFSSFVWRVPCAGETRRKDADGSTYFYASPKSLGVNRHSRSESAIRDGECKAGNKMCSLQVKARKYILAAKACDICCSEPGFCRDCCCILCCTTIDLTCGGYRIIRCEGTVDGNYVCGHVAHIDCALRSYMAGMVGGSIGLDAEYYCRRCDNKTDLVSHVTKFIRTCESLDSQEDIEKVLNLGFCILRGSKQTWAKELENRLEYLMTKLKHGVHLDEILKVKVTNLATAEETTHTNANDSNRIGSLGGNDN